MKSKRIISGLVSILMATMLLSSCGKGNADSTASGSGTGENKENMMCRYVVPGTAPEESPMVDEEITKQLNEDGINMTFERIYIPWDVWQQKVNLMLSSGEEFELLHVMQDQYPVPTYVAQNAFVPIDEHLDKYGKKLKEIIPNDIWEGAKVDGKVYTIPVYYRDFSSQSYIPLVKNWFDKYKIDTDIKSFDQLTESLATIVKNEKNPNLKWWAKLSPAYEDWQFRECESYPFSVKDCLFYIGNDGTVKGWLDSPEFKQVCDVARGFYENGIYHKDILTIPHDQVGNYQSEGFDLSCDIFSLAGRRDKAPDTEIFQPLFSPDKPLSRGDFSFMNCNSVSATSPNPEAGVIFFNWLYSSEENYSLLNYGIEDRHWKDCGDRRYEIIKGEDEQNPKYSFGDWEMGHKDLVKLDAKAPEEVEQVAFEMNPDAITSAASGFIFNTEPVSTEYTNCMAEIEAVIYPLKYGVVSYEDAYDNAMKTMRAAGYDKVVAEFEKQFNEWHKNK